MRGRNKSSTDEWPTDFSMTLDHPCPFASDR